MVAGLSKVHRPDARAHAPPHTHMRTPDVHLCMGQPLCICKWGTGFPALQLAPLAGCLRLLQHSSLVRQGADHTPIACTLSSQPHQGRIKVHRHTVGRDVLLQ